MLNEKLDKFSVCRDACRWVTAKDKCKVGNFCICGSKFSSSSWRSLKHLPISHLKVLKSCFFVWDEAFSAASKENQEVNVRNIFVPLQLSYKIFNRDLLVEMKFIVIFVDDCNLASIHNSAMTSEKLNWENLLVLVGLRVVDNFIYVFFVNFSVWSKIVWSTRLQKPFLGWLVQHLVDPVVLNFFISRELFLQEDHRVHLKVQLITQPCFFLFPEVVASEPHRHNIRTCFVFFKLFEFFNFSDNLLLSFRFHSMLCFKFYFFAIALPWVPSLVLVIDWLILLEVLFDQAHLMVVLNVNLVPGEHLLEEVALVLRLLDQSVKVSFCGHDRNVRNVVAKRLLQEVVHQFCILECLLQISVNLLRMLNSWSDSFHFLFFINFIVLLSFFILASMFIPQVKWLQTHALTLCLSLGQILPFTEHCLYWSNFIFFILLRSHLFMGFNANIVKPLEVNEAESLLRLEWLLFKPLVNRLTLSHNNNNFSELTKIFPNTPTNKTLSHDF